MIHRQNCWEFKNCGRHPGGTKVTEFGVCPAAVDTSYDGLNGEKTGVGFAGQLVVHSAMGGDFC